MLHAHNLSHIAHIRQQTHTQNKNSYHTIFVMYDEWKKLSIFNLYNFKTEKKTSLTD